MRHLINNNLNRIKDQLSIILGVEKELIQNISDIDTGAIVIYMPCDCSYIDYMSPCSPVVPACARGPKPGEEALVLSIGYATGYRGIGIAIARPGAISIVLAAFSF